MLKLLAGCEQLEDGKPWVLTCDLAPLGAVESMKCVAATVKELQLRYCSAIPSNGWMELCNAKWAQLMKAEFWECLGREGRSKGGHSRESKRMNAVQS